MGKSGSLMGLKLEVKVFCEFNPKSSKQAKGRSTGEESVRKEGSILDFE